MKRMTTNEFILKAKKTHEEVYDYSFVEYKNNKTKVVIMCAKHGKFNQTPLAHLNGHGCCKCRSEYMSKTLRMSIHEFVKKAKKVHGEKYDYSKSNYTLLKNSVNIVCKKHGEFSQNTHNHLQGAGCVICAKETPTKVIEERKIKFIKKSKLTHGNNYCYDHVNYVNSTTKVSIVCQEHGEFKQTPNDHLKGVGCPGCANYGFDRTNDGFLYILRSDCGRYMKIGITHNPKQRYIQLSKSTPFSFKRIELIEGPGEQIANVEKELLAKYRPAEFTETFNGSTEWRIWDHSIMNVIKLMEDN